VVGDETARAQYDAQQAARAQAKGACYGPARPGPRRRVLTQQRAAWGGRRTSSKQKCFQSRGRSRSFEKSLHDVVSVLPCRLCPATQKPLQRTCIPSSSALHRSLFSEILPCAGWPGLDGVPSRRSCPIQAGAEALRSQGPEHESQPPSFSRSPRIPMMYRKALRVSIAPCV
jgi:hypothetical protein